MEMEVLKKKISTFKGPSGRIGKLSDDLLFEVLTAWENWPGSRLSFYSAIGVSQKGFASIIGKAKKLKREGHFPAEEFKELQLASTTSVLPNSSYGSYGILLRTEDRRVIKFREVDQLVDFLNKTEKKAS
jgi:hypothetical protein